MCKNTQSKIQKDYRKGRVEEREREREREREKGGDVVGEKTTPLRSVQIKIKFQRQFILFKAVKLTELILF